MEEWGLATALSCPGGLQETTREEVQDLQEGPAGAPTTQVESQEEPTGLPSEHLPQFMGCGAGRGASLSGKRFSERFPRF